MCTISKRPFAISRTSSGSSKRLRMTSIGLMGRGSEDGLAERGEDQLHAEAARAVVLVQDGVRLDQVHRDHAVGVADDLEREVALPVVDAALDRRADVG